MRILALEPYYGGSHQAFLDGWIARSRHTWTVLTLAPYKWKWRMRHAAITLAQQVCERVGRGEAWDAVFCSDMLNLAEYRGLTAEAVRRLPTIGYFHENQLTYPVRHESERDYHFVLTNLTTGLAADVVWFNTAYHRDALLGALPGFLDRMPDHQPYDAIEAIRAKSVVHPPGIDPMPECGPRRSGPMRICWAGRWEHDKNPEDFFEALRRLREMGVAFRLSVLGEQFRDVPAVFDQARGAFADRIDRWGYQTSREAYVAALLDADVFVSTARHEFFGISAVEAMAAGAVPVLPDRLAYPEIVAGVGRAAGFLYDGTVEGLVSRLAELADRIKEDEPMSSARHEARRVAERFAWDRVAVEMDEAAVEAGSGARDPGSGRTGKRD